MPLKTLPVTTFNSSFGRGAVINLEEETQVEKSVSPLELCRM
jgi:hypothetical protein